jgi:hypothetical protein
LLTGECSPAGRGTDAKESELTLSSLVSALDGFTVGWAVGLLFGLAVSVGLPSGDSGTGAGGTFCSPGGGAIMLDMEGECTGARDGSVGCLAVSCPVEGDKPAVGFGGRVGIRSGGNALGIDEDDVGVKDGSAVDFLVSWLGDELGNDDGASVGANVGIKDGADVGTDDGDGVGAKVGTDDDSELGKDEGKRIAPAKGLGGRVGIRSGGNALGIDEDDVGVKDGSAVDFLVSWLGDELGNDVGASVGANVGIKDGAEVGDDVG